MKTAIVLVHGFSGSPATLFPVAKGLGRHLSDCRIINPAIAGDWAGGPAGFDLGACRKQFADIVSDCRRRAEKIVLVGHSTGGNLLLSFLAQGLIKPELLVLVGTPWKIGVDYLQRWQKHAPVAGQMSLGALSHLISFVNRDGTAELHGGQADFPVLLVSGEADELVPVSAASALQENVFSGKAGVLLIPGLRHHFVDDGAATDFLLEKLSTAIDDIQNLKPLVERPLVDKITECEPEFERFVNFSPASSRHLLNAPSAKLITGEDLSFPAEVASAPVFANIEITTRCNLNCLYCARKFIRPQSQEMTRLQFNRILDLLPHAYRVTLVGLGEPLLHSELAEFIFAVERRGRRSGIVTNAMALDSAGSAAILQASLKSVAFSLDAASQKTLEALRSGSDFAQIIVNIKNFMGMVQKEGAALSTAVFSALSQVSLDELDGLAELVAGLGVHVWMVTDLNFRQNIAASLSSSHGDGAGEKDIAAAIRRAIKSAFGKGLPVLSVRALEAFGLRKRYQNFLLFSPEAVLRRSVTHRWCHSPWQTLPINVNGDVTLCDCQPDQVIGNIFQQPLAEIWNGSKMVSFRKKMTSTAPPPACLACPRF